MLVIVLTLDFLQVSFVSIYVSVILWSIYVNVIILVFMQMLFFKYHC